MNFPTKNKWRANSKIEYINDGLDELIKLIHQLNIKSIAIPPLGSGNGGLIWSEVKEIIEKKLSVLDGRIDIFIYEPSQNYVSLPTVEPKLSMSALVLMEMKKDLNKFDTLRLQKTAYFMNIFAKEQYFEFKKHKYGPYANSISIISRTIREFQKYHNVKNTQEAYKILYNKIISEKIQNRMKILTPSILKATQYVNSIETNHELECIATVAFIIEKKNGLSGEEILQNFKGWSIDKATRFSNDDILEAIKKLYNDGIIEKNLTGYVLA